jgi:hypothetical protein
MRVASALVFCSWVEFGSARILLASAYYFSCCFLPHQFQNNPPLMQRKAETHKIMIATTASSLVGNV